MNTKYCSNCTETLPIDQFNQKSITKTGQIRYQPYCRNCNKIHSRAYYARNRDAHKKEVSRRRKIYTAEKQEKLIEFFLNHPCVDCNATDIRILEFDHLIDKEATISTIIRSWSWSRIQAEILKCDVVCGDCHTIRTRKRNNDFRYKAWVLLQNQIEL